MQSMAVKVEVVPSLTERGAGKHSVERKIVGQNGAVVKRRVRSKMQKWFGIRVGEWRKTRYLLYRTHGMVTELSG